MTNPSLGTGPNTEGPETNHQPRDEVSPAETAAQPRGQPPSVDQEDGLFHRVSRSVFWNTVLLPLITVLNAALSVLIRRGFGLGSGVYDVLMGLLHTTLVYMSVGIPQSLTKWLPEIQTRHGTAAARALLMKAAATRLTLLGVALLGLNAAAEYVSGRLDLGADGVAYIRILSALILARAAVELSTYALQSSFEHLWTNLLSLAQAILDPAMIVLAFALGYGMSGVLGALALSGGLLCVAAGGRLVRVLKRPAGYLPRHAVEAPLIGPQDTAGEPPSPMIEVVPTSGGAGQYVRFAGFTFLLGLTMYFSRPGFASPALAAILGDHRPVALFATAFYVSFMVVTLMVSSFRGVYAPMFAHLRTDGAYSDIRRPFRVVNKLQVLMLVPAGVGLAVMVEDYIPLLYGPAFAPAIPIARVLIALMFTETAFSLGNVVLYIDERYREVLGAQALRVLSVPLFLWGAAQGGILVAAVVLGTARALAHILAYRIAARRYGVQFPWRFAVKIVAVSGVMGAVVFAAQRWWPTSPTEAVTLTVVGVAVFTFGIRAARVLGPEEIELLGRTRLPCSAWASRWLAPSQ